jgi:site-specific recombinase XerD
MHTNSLEEDIKGFGSHLKRLGRSDKTIQAYLWTLRPFCTYCLKHKVKNLSGITHDLLESWQDHLTSELSELTNKPLSVGSRSLASTGLRMFLLWAAQREKCDARLSLWIETVKLPDLQPRPLKSDAMVRVRHYFLERSGTPRYLRDRALFSYLIGTGCRVSEALQVPRIGFERAVVIQKGGSSKIMICPGSVAEAVREYLQIRNDDCPLLFVQRPGNATSGPLSPAATRRIWTRLAKHLNIPRFTTHQLRHTAASALLRAGEDPMTVATFLGHKNLNHLRIYAEVPEAQRARAASTMDRFLQAG